MGARGVLRTVEGGRYMFWCPGCDEAHVVGPSWTFNGNFDQPTFTPSIKVTSTKIERGADGKWTGEWVRDAHGTTIPEICHSFVTDGLIQFLGDCTHALADQTVALQPMPDEEAT